jgi:probable addiction module antidote protein
LDAEDVHSANYEKAMQIFDLHRFFLACVGCVFWLGSSFGSEWQVDPKMRHSTRIEVCSRPRRSLMKKNAPLNLIPFDAAKYLHDDAAIAEYMDAVLEANEPALLLLALGDVARAKGMAQVAKDAGLGRESLYKALAPGAKPRFETVMKVAQALGLKFTMSQAAAKALPQYEADDGPLTAIQLRQVKKIAALPATKRSVRLIPPFNSKPA